MSDPIREQAERVWRWSWARTINLCLPGWLHRALPGPREEMPVVVTMSDADNDPAAIHYIAVVLEKARADATREALVWALPRTCQFCAEGNPPVQDKDNPGIFDHWGKDVGMPYYLGVCGAVEVRARLRALAAHDGKESE